MNRMKIVPSIVLSLFLLASAEAQDNKPNILVIFGDDIGYWNVSYNTGGMMGYTTPNIDRLAREGLRFTDYYGESRVPPAVPPSSPARCRCAPA